MATVTGAVACEEIRHLEWSALLSLNNSWTREHTGWCVLVYQQKRMRVSGGLLGYHSTVV